MTHARGYTLVEVLVAVLIFAILAGSAYVALDGLSRAAADHRERAEAFAAVQLALARLDSDLRQVVTRPVRDPDGREHQPPLIGQRLELAATRAGWDNPSGQRRGNLQRFSWQFADGRLERTAWPVTDRVAGGPSIEETVLEGLSEFTLRYRDPQGRWRDEWPVDADHADMLPRAIEVGLDTEKFGRLRRLVVIH